MTERTDDRKSLAMFIMTMLIFGTIGVVRKFIPLPSAFLAFARGILGGLFLLVFVKARGKQVFAGLTPGEIFHLALTGAVIGFNWILLFEAYNYTTVAAATLCYYMQPTIVMLLSPLIFRERLTGKKIICAVISVIGMVFVSGIIGSGAASSRNMTGILLGLGAAVFYSAVVILNKKLPGIDPYQRATIQLLSAGIVMVPYLLMTNGFVREGITLPTLLLVLFFGIVLTGFTYALYFGSMEGLRVQTIAIFSYIDPAATLLFSFLLLGEPLTLPGAAGAVMIIGSAIMSEYEKTD